MYTKIDLPYSYDALKPVLDQKTVQLHYEKLYGKYVTKLNQLLEQNHYKNEYRKEELVNHLDIFPIQDRDQILYYLGGTLNHELYFLSMNPTKIHQPISSIQRAIDEEYGNYENFKIKFIETASYLVGSGYTFLVVTPEGKLDIINLSNQDTPYEYNLTPILALDLWEHAYYLDYFNHRDQYIKNFFDIIDFEHINELYEKAISKKK